MERTAKVFFSNRSQAVRLPKEFQFAVKEVYIYREDDKVILSPRPSNWNEYLSTCPVAPQDYMVGVEDLPLQKRDL